MLPSIVLIVCILVLIVWFLNSRLSKDRDRLERNEAIQSVGLDKFLAIGVDQYIKAIETCKPIPLEHARKLWFVACIGATKGALDAKSINHYFNSHIISKLRERDLIL